MRRSRIGASAPRAVVLGRRDYARNLVPSVFQNLPDPLGRIFVGTGVADEEIAGHGVCMLVRRFKKLPK